jgi:hypothetical protein
MLQLGLTTCLMDNARPHRHAQLRLIFAAFGLHVKFLPKYRPWYNPIEFLFNATKQVCRMDTYGVQADFVRNFIAVLEGHPAATCAAEVAKAGYV